MKPMNNKLLMWVAGIAATLCVACAGALLNTWADVREMKQAMASQVKAERIAIIEGDLKAHELQADERRAANEQRFVAIENRVKSIEWQRNRDSERSR